MHKGQLLQYTKEQKKLQKPNVGAFNDKLCAL